MPDKQPITIQRGTFVCNIYDVGNLMRLPLASVRKLWKIMFSAADENRETIQTIRDWLPYNIESAKRSSQERKELFEAAAKEVERLRREVASFGSVATKEQKAALATAGRNFKAFERTAKAAAAEHAKTQKLQTIFNEFITKQGGISHVSEHPHQSSHRRGAPVLRQLDRSPRRTTGRRA